MTKNKTKENKENENYAEADVVILTTPKYLDIILSIFLYQQDKETTISKITQISFRPTNYQDITKTAEYNMCRRILSDLEKEDLIIKIKPSKKDEYKTHYKINLVGLTDFIMKFLKRLPTYSSRTLFDNFKYKGNKLIRNYIGVYFRALSIDILDFKVKDEEKILFLDLMTIKDSIFIIIDKLVLIYLPKFNLKKKYYRAQLEELEKEDKNKAGFLQFLIILANLNEDYLPYQYIIGFNRDLEDFVLLGTSRKQATEERPKIWFNESIKKIMEDEEEIFKNRYSRL